MSRPRFRVRGPHRHEVEAARVVAWRNLARSRARASEAGPDEDPLLWCRWTWWPAPHDEPGPYEPTIVVHHGGAGGRCITYDLIVVRDTPLFRTPAFWRRVRPGVLAEQRSLTAAERKHRVRFGVYFYEQDQGTLPDPGLSSPTPRRNKRQGSDT